MGSGKKESPPVAVATTLPWQRPAATANSTTNRELSIVDDVTSDVTVVSPPPTASDQPINKHPATFNSFDGTDLKRSVELINQSRKRFSLGFREGSCWVAVWHATDTWLAPTARLKSSAAVGASFSLLLSL